MLKKLIILLLISSCATIPVDRSEVITSDKKNFRKYLKEFTSDGCSYWPDGTREKPDAWLECCYEHDRDYWLGGTRDQRKMSDLRLKECVKQEFADWMGILMLLGVRVGGRPNYDTSYKWGYGWTYERGYIEVSKEELDYANRLSPFSKTNYKYLKK